MATNKTWHRVLASADLLFVELSQDDIVLAPERHGMLARLQEGWWRGSAIKVPGQDRCHPTPHEPGQLRRARIHGATGRRYHPVNVLVACPLRAAMNNGTTTTRISLSPGF